MVEYRILQYQLVEPAKPEPVEELATDRLQEQVVKPAHEGTAPREGKKQTDPVLVKDQYTLLGGQRLIAGFEDKKQTPFEIPKDEDLQRYLHDRPKQLIQDVLGACALNILKDAPWPMKESSRNSAKKIALS